MYNTKKNVLKAGIWYTISSVTVKAILVITTPLYTRLLSASDYGIASTFTSWYTLLLAFSTLNLTYSIGRAKLDFPGMLNGYVGSLQLLSAVFTTLASAAVIVLLGPVSAFLELDKTLVVLLLLYLLLAPAISFTQSKYRYEYRYRGNIAITVYTTVATIAATLILIFVFNDRRYMGKVLGSIIPAGVLSILFWYQALKKRMIRIDPGFWKYGLSISLPLILHSVSMNILSQSDRIMITKYCGTDYTGIYSVAYSFAVLINIILNAINEAWLPWFHDTFYAGDTNSIRQNIKPLIILGCYLGTGCIAIAPEAMKILGPLEYQSGKWVVAPVALGVICQFIYQQYVHIELHLKKTKYISAGTVIAAVLNILLNMVFIPRYGFIAAAYTTLASYLALMLVHLFITGRILRVNIYNNAFMFASLACTALAAAVMMCLYKYIVLRYSMILAVSLIYLALNREMLQSFLKKRKLIFM